MIVKREHQRDEGCSPRLWSKIGKEFQDEEETKRVDMEQFGEVLEKQVSVRVMGMKRMPQPSAIARSTKP